MERIKREKIKIIQADLLDFHVSRWNVDIELVDFDDEEAIKADTDGKSYKIAFTDEEGFLDEDAVAALSFGLLNNADSMNTYLVLYDGEPVIIIMPRGYNYEDKTPLYVHWNSFGEAIGYFLMGSEPLKLNGDELKLWK